MNNGETVIRPFVVDNGPDYFKEGLAPFRIDNKFGFFDRKGKIIIRSQFDFAFPFHEGLAAICVGCKEGPEGEYHSVKGGTWGYINRGGAKLSFQPNLKRQGILRMARQR